MTSMPGNGAGSGNYGAEGGRERGTRRRKLAAMASSVYRASATAVNEIRETYSQTRSIDPLEMSNITIPGSFPDVAIVTKGNEQMVLFPSYAFRHVKSQPRQFESPGGPSQASGAGMNEQEFWRNEWSRHEDEKAIVDVNVRGWIYYPHRGPITSSTRFMINLAKKLCGIPISGPRKSNSSPSAEPSSANRQQEEEEEREQEMIAREAKAIERRGLAEEAVAEKGNYSERLRGESADLEGNRRRLRQQSQDGSQSPPSAPSSPVLRGRTDTTKGSDLTEAELAVANANLMARVAPFLTTPLVQLPITLFFYNDSRSQSRTVTTNEAGHFAITAALDFVPTHVRVLANEDISYTEPVHIIEPKGISMISDVDDTIKRSNISAGAKETFRNTFARELRDLTVDGVQDWYNSMYDLGVRIHYCSNSPWQLYPVLATFMKIAGLPPGSLHLKRYSGIMQGIFEPVAERKKGVLEKILMDFPQRKFLLVGDSGEADLEVYTDLAVANPGRIAAIFIRDITTPEQTGYFDSGTPRNISDVRRVQRSSDDSSVPKDLQLPIRPPLPPRVATSPKPANEPVIGDLIDFSEEPETEPLRRVESDSKVVVKPVKPTDLLGRKPPPPPKPAKPRTLQSSPAAPVLTTGSSEDGVGKKPAPPPPTPRKTSQPNISNRALTPSPLAQMQRSTDHEQTPPLPKPRSRSETPTTSSTSLSSSRMILPPPPPPPPRRRATPTNTTTITRPSTSPRLAAVTNTLTAVSNTLNRRRTADSEGEFEALPLAASSTYSSGSGHSSPTPPTKKVEAWRRRLRRAQETLEQQGVALYTWRRGDEVVDEAVGIVKACLEEMQGRQGGSD